MQCAATNVISQQLLTRVILMMFVVWREGQAVPCALPQQYGDGEGRRRMGDVGLIP